MTDGTSDDNEPTNRTLPPTQTQELQAMHKSMFTLDHSQPSSRDSQESPERRSRAGNLLGRISFGRPKGIKELAVEDLENRRQAQSKETDARKDVASSERRARRDREKRDRKESRKASKERDKHKKEEKNKRKADERRVNDYYGIRGYDPNAGTLLTRPEQVLEELSRTEVRSWGLEFGRPKYHAGKGHFSGHHESCGEQYGRNADAIGGEVEDAVRH